MRLAAEGLVVRYPGAAAPAVDGVDLDVAPGTFHAVLGPNGSGKSTLMRALLGAVPRAGGRVLLDGRPLEAWSRRELARSVGAVPQAETIAFPLTTRELVAMGRYPHLGPLASEGEEDRRAVRRALEACGVAELGARDVATLSGGELQRARIARALAQEPRALVLDEPTASLDVRHEMEILELLRRAAGEGITVLLITHGLDVAAQFADHLVLLSQGRVAAEGPPGEVLREDVLERVYGWPIAVRPDPLTGLPRVTPVRARAAESAEGAAA
ncbi:MAG TPA: ABC transporter ATP-binding protein, partial [Longimicrobiales bacterium]|nr:ABC transporter ATP-binding protein [Longimicrobiales bacterium]